MLPAELIGLTQQGSGASWRIMAWGHWNSVYSDGGENECDSLDRH